MTTLGAMTTEIEGDLGRTDFSGTNGVIETKIREAILFFQPQHFYFNDNDALSYNTVVNQVKYTDTYEWYDLKEVFLENVAGQRYVLTLKDYSNIMILTDGSSSSSQPLSYARYLEATYLYPKPNLATYTIRQAGHYKIDPPASSGEAANPWMTKAYDLIMHEAKRRIYVDRLKDRDKANSQAAMVAVALEQLNDQTVKKRRTSRIRSNPF